jgi:hypothetical protein
MYEAISVWAKILFRISLPDSTCGLAVTGMSDTLMQEIVFSYFLSGLKLQLRHKTAGVVCAVQSINSCGNAVARSSNKIMYKPTNVTPSHQTWQAPHRRHAQGTFLTPLLPLLTRNTDSR